MNWLRITGESTQFFLILGADEAADFPNWRNPEKITQEATVVVAPRTGYETKTVEGLLPLSVSLPDISSSEIRKKAADKGDLANDVHPGVAEYLLTYRLYLQDY